MSEEETCGHVLACSESGRVDHFRRSMDLLDRWLRESHTEPDLAFCISEFARSRGGASLQEMARGLSPLHITFAKHQDMIGWRRFLEGMVASEGQLIQAGFLRLHGIRGNAKTWAANLTTKLLECTHGQWLYRNIMVHDRDCGITRTLRKEQILLEIEAQLMNGDPLSEEDQYLLEINVGDMGRASGE